ncbi:MAG: hypothetical protein AABO58_25595 [Acidobacteriota bacterium]
MRLDDILPQWQFRERHAIRIDAPPERVYAAIRAVTAREIRFFRAFTALRRLGRRGPEGILNPPPDEPILDVATRTGFELLADDPPHELVVGLRISRHVLAAMNFLIEGPEVSTETRIHTATRRAAWQFGLYWVVIRAGSGILRRTWLRAVKRRALSASSG